MNIERLPVNSTLLGSALAARVRTAWWNGDDVLESLCAVIATDNTQRAPRIPLQHGARPDRESTKAQRVLLRCLESVR